MSKSKKLKTDKKGNKDEKHEHPNHRSIWNGYITFGLVNIPVILQAAEKPVEEVHFKLLDKHKLSGIKYIRINEETGKEVPWENIVKGFEYEPGNYVILTDDDFKSIARENLKSIEIEDFVDLKDISSLYFEKPYYALPDKRGEKGYTLLLETLKKTHKIGIGRVMIRTHLYLAAIMPFENIIIINILRYPKEVKTPSEMGIQESKYKISKKEFSIAEQLVETMSVKWDPKRYANEYRDDLMKLIKKKVASGGTGSTKHLEEPKIKKTNVIDFMALLKQSIKEKKQYEKTPKNKKK